MEGREGERTGERLKRGKGGAQRKEKRAKEVERRAFGGVWACFGAIFGARGGFDGVQLHDAQGWAFKRCINSV